ncbi:MAG: family 20 glycosylhydrolase [Bacteroidaceae bacterium]|nr:family 20 glycosylhydrolase [Bacteroidaceae bacterium]
MKKAFLYLVSLFCAASLSAQEFPTISTDGNDVWYLIQFMNGGETFAASSDGAQIATASATAADEQQWKITGNATDGYSFTNKKGYTLYVPSAAKNQMVSAASSPKGVSRFHINATTNSSYPGGYEIQPVGNNSVSMNLWGGPGSNRGIGLWDKGDPNNPVTFTSVKAALQEAKISIIPYPKELTFTKEDERKALSTLTAIVCPDEATQKMATEFATMLQEASSIKLAVKTGGDEESEGLILLLVDAALADEAYTLDVTEKGIEIKASGDAGFLYALQTLKQLLPRSLFGHNEEAPDWSLPYLSIKDEPQYGHRGFMMDVARHFFDKDEVKRVLDIMALYKMNRLHWHLTDDQGWRIEIPEYPLLTEVGAVRSGSFTSPGEGTKFFDDTEYGRGMWFSQADLREIVAYAAERNIDILPEIDLPGHMVAAVTAYPEFSCDPTKKYSVRLDGGISEDVLNIGKDEVIDFLKCVLDNVAAIFPYPYIHIGGDECPTKQWQTNEDCLRRVREEGLSGVNELQSWLVEELGTYLKEKHGKDIVVWDELLSHWSSSNKVKPVIMAWNSIGKSADAANKGFKSIITPYSHVYLDFMQVPADRTIIDEPYYGGWGDSHVNTIEEVYSLNPVSSLGGREEYCMGVQGNLWAETLNDAIELEYQLLPRMLALAETGWLPAAKKSWGSFYKRLQTHDEILDALGYTYAKHYIEQPTPSDEEQTMLEAESILKASIRGAVGYPSAELHDALAAAIAGGDATAVAAAVEAYKRADITQPEIGKSYQIVSASTYYKKQFAGSTMYVSNDGVRFHYTPQVEPEELWQFEAQESGYILRNLCDGRLLSMPSYNAAVKMGEAGTALRIDKATVATRDYTFIPGVVTISAVAGYKPTATGSIKRLHAELSGNVNAYNNPALCYPGTWYIVEVSDFTAQLRGLCNKCERIIEKAVPGSIGEPTVEALDFLSSSLITPAKALLEQGGVSQETYSIYVALYNQFLQMPRTNIIDALREDVYYYIRNAYFTNYYAVCSNSGRVEPKTKGNGNGYLWSLRKNDDGTVSIYSKLNGKSAYIANDVADQTVRVGRDYSWTLEQMTVDTGDTGICIIGEKGATSWYINPDTWNYVLTKPFWGASIWSFEASAVEVETSIETIENEGRAHDIFDLQGRRIEHPAKGIYIINGKKVYIK